MVDSLPYQCKTSAYEYGKTGVKGAAGILGTALTFSLGVTNPILGLASLYLSYKASDIIIDDK